MTNTPTVTAVIPTRNRPQLVCNAVESALRQTYPNLEVVVVVDGKDPATENMLAQVCDRRLRVIVLPENRGCAHCRNIGVDTASGEWIAFLDDDDEWLPQKTELQIAVARKSRHRFPVIFSRFVARTPDFEYLWPRRAPSPGEDISDYLFGRRNLFQGEGYMATPTLLARKDLLVQLPLQPHLRKHEDWDWILHAAKREGVGFEFAGEPLAIVRIGTKRNGLSNSDDWQSSLDWIRERRDQVSPHAYAAFILTVVADQASRSATLAEYLTLPVESCRNGDPSLFDFLLYAGMRLIPQSARHNLRQLCSNRARLERFQLGQLQ
jgi:glycosyltransferase involved in cell wall biosynthesis